MNATGFMPDVSDADALVDEGEFCARMHWSRDKLVKAVAKEIVFYVEEHGSRRYPAFNAEPKFERRPLAAVSRRLSGLPAGSKWQFFRTPKGSLGGLRPLEALLQGKVAAVKRCAEGFATR